MIKNKISVTRAFLLPAVIAALLSACAGSRSDFSQANRFVAVKQQNLIGWMAPDAYRNAIRPVIAPVCSSDVGRPATGWGLEDGNWCVVACLTQSLVIDQQWIQTDQGQRCYSTSEPAGALVDTEFQMQQWQLDQLALFSGFEQSFLNDTEWHCKEQVYQIDPNSRRASWIDIRAGNSYRFFQDGTLMVASPGEPMRVAGDWRRSQGKGVIINDQALFEYSLNDEGGRFEEYRSATRKQYCRYADIDQSRI